MNNQFIPYSLALLANQKGFNEYFKIGNVTSLYDKEGNHVPYTNYGVMYSGLSDGYISAPLFQQLIDWFREKHSIKFSENHLEFESIRYALTRKGEVIETFLLLDKAFIQAFKLIP